MFRATLRPLDACLSHDQPAPLCFHVFGEPDVCWLQTESFQGPHGSVANSYGIAEQRRKTALPERGEGDVSEGFNLLKSTRITRSDNESTLSIETSIHILAEGIRLLSCLSKTQPLLLSENRARRDLVFVYEKNEMPYNESTDEPSPATIRFREAC